VRTTVRPLVLAAVALGLAAPPAAAAERYELDPDRTEIAFSWGFAGSTQTASFARMDGTVVVDPADLDAAVVDVVIDPTSVDTGLAFLDDILQSPRFFASAEHPEIRFVATDVRAVGETAASLAGDLTIKGVTRRVVLDARLADEGTRPPLDAAAPVTIVATASVLRWEWDLGGTIPLASDAVRITIRAALAPV
jgi:polyisoprenoid-binding protein YceI